MPYRWMLFVLGLLVSTVALKATGEAPPRPKRPTLSAALTVQGTTLTLRYTVNATANPDSVAVFITATGTADRRWVYRNVASKTDSLTAIPRPAPGATATATIRAVAYKFNLASDPSATVSRSYTEPVTPPPPPTVDSVEIYPTSATLQPLQSQQFTATVTTS